VGRVECPAPTSDSWGGGSCRGDDKPRHLQSVDKNTAQPLNDCSAPLVPCHAAGAAHRRASVRQRRPAAVLAEHSLRRLHQHHRQAAGRWEACMPLPCVPYSLRKKHADQPACWPTCPAPPPHPPTHTHTHTPQACTACRPCSSCWCAAACWLPARCLTCATRLHARSSQTGAPLASPPPRWPPPLSNLKLVET
jgi:hypothetical protein